MFLNDRYPNITKNELALFNYSIYSDLVVADGKAECWISSSRMLQQYHLPLCDGNPSRWQLLLRREQEVFFRTVYLMSLVSFNSKASRINSIDLSPLTTIHACAAAEFRQFGLAFHHMSNTSCRGLDGHSKNRFKIEFGSDLPPLKFSVFNNKHFYLAVVDGVLFQSQLVLM